MKRMVLFFFLTTISIVLCAMDSKKIITYSKRVQKLDVVKRGKRCELQSKINLMEDELECSICLENLSKNIITTPCQHVFHSSCLKPWAEKNNSCPYCRAVLVKPPTCTICREACLKQDATRTACKHIFHRACLGQWTDTYQKETCPNCRGELFTFGQKIGRKLQAMKKDFVALFLICLPQCYKERNE